MIGQVLIFRLSSLGDVVLATSALDALAAIRENVSVDWVVAREFAPVLRGDPRIRRLWEFDRNSGLRGWVDLCRELSRQGYAEVYDLHRSLRSWIARGLFFWWALGKRSRAPLWHRVSKQRVRSILFVLFKNILPQAWRPKAWIERYSEAVEGKSGGRPNLRHMLAGPSEPIALPESFICVMPSARWSGKTWPAKNYVQLVCKIKLPVVVLGLATDQQSLDLMRELQTTGIQCVSAIGWSLSLVAQVLAQAKAYLGSDTGLAHVAEALGTPTWVLFGPTHPHQGFGPWLPTSRALGVRLWCRPCGKDGRACFRPISRHLCLKSFLPEEGWSQLK